VTSPPTITTLFHCSDLHFGHPAVPEQYEAIEAIIQDRKYDVVAISGDVSQRARAGEFQRARAFIQHAEKVSQTIVVPGNHDVATAGGAPYYNYFGANAGPPGSGYYSYDYGAWHIVALHSTISMKSGPAQANWLQEDLDASDTACTLAYWHHPLFTSGPNGNNTAVRDAWSILFDHGVEVVVNGHDHIYERFAPQDAIGRPNADIGIRQFTVGTGGAYLTKVERIQANSEVQHIAWGVLKLTLRSAGYDWEFVVCLAAASPTAARQPVTGASSLRTWRPEGPRSPSA
jgi:predicted phosphodiesterase